MAKINSETILLIRRLLSSWTVFYQKAHTYHWDLTGGNFLPFHKHLGKIYNESVDHADSVAERVRQLGEKIALTLNEASADSVVQDENTASTSEEIARDLISGIAQLTALQTEIYNAAEEQGDYITVDLMVQLSKWCEFNSWFLASIVGAENKTNM